MNTFQRLMLKTAFLLLKSQWYMLRMMNNPGDKPALLNLLRRQDIFPKIGDLQGEITEALK